MKWHICMMVSGACALQCLTRLLYVFFQANLPLFLIAAVLAVDIDEKLD